MKIYELKHENTGMYFGVSFPTVKQAIAFIRTYYSTEKDNISIWRCEGDKYIRVVWR